MQPTWCTIFLSMFSSFSLHVLGHYVPIIRRNNCFYATLVTWHSVVDDCLVCRVEYHALMNVWYAGYFTLHTRQSSIQSDKYQVLHKYSYFSWWWAHIHLKHVEKRNKRTKKNCAPSWLYLQEYCKLLSAFVGWYIDLNIWSITKFLYMK